MLFEQAVFEYVEAKQNGRKKVRPNTLEGYLSAIKCHLMPKWAGREMESITADELQAWVDTFELAGAARKAFGTYTASSKIAAGTRSARPAQWGG